ncbi:MAG: protein kinase [Chlamydiota bacterium]|nr:protein kinase [Chlamydiota bacterium]
MFSSDPLNNNQMSPLNTVLLSDCKENLSPFYENVLEKVEGSVNNPKIATSPLTKRTREEWGVSGPAIFDRKEPHKKLQMTSLPASTIYEIAVTKLGVNQSAFVEVDGENYLVLQPHSSEKPKVYRWSGKADIQKGEANYLGRGGFGTVQKIEDLMTHESVALKLAVPKVETQREHAVQSIQNEYTFLKELHADGNNENLQDAPTAMVDTAYKTSRLVGLIEPLYEKGDLSSMMNSLDIGAAGLMSREECKNHALQLLKGVRSLHIKNIVHGDIKPGNIFVEESKDGAYHLKVADLGEAVKCESYLKGELPKKTLITAASPGYLTRGDIKLAKKNMCGLVRNDTDEKRKLRFDDEKRRDIFAIGVTVWELLSGHKPYLLIDNDKKNKFSFPDTNIWTIPGSETINQNYGKEFAGALKKAIGEDPSERPSAEQLVEILESVDLSKGPFMYQENNIGFGEEVSTVSNEATIIAPFDTKNNMTVAIENETQLAGETCLIDDGATVVLT